MTVTAFLHFLYWASHYLWLCFAPDNTGTGNHIVYGGNVLDCITQTIVHPTIHWPGGDIANHCIQSAP